MADETFHICETCRERIEPDAPDTVRAVEMHKALVREVGGEVLRVNVYRLPDG